MFVGYRIFRQFVKSIARFPPYSEFKLYQDKGLWAITLVSFGSLNVLVFSFSVAGTINGLRLRRIFVNNLVGTPWSAKGT
jgi:hypothetical protein